VIAIPVTGSTKCYKAAEWCEQNLVFEDWEMWLSESSWTRYTFEFQKEEDAVWFALRWAE
jgi:hypothetical protein